MRVYMPEHMCMHHIIQESEEVRSPRTGIIDCCKLSCGSLELNARSSLRALNTFLTAKLSL